MEALLKIVLLILFSLIAYQDFKYRAVSWMLFPLAFVFILWVQLLDKPFTLLITYSLLNALIIVIQLLALSLYFSIKAKKFVILTKNKLGLGDVLCFIILCMGFSPLNYIVFLLLVLLTGLIFTLIFKLLIRDTNPKIPLASYLSIGFTIVLIAEQLMLIHPYNDLLISIIN